ncbi:hypothetical protein ACQP1P_02370 [Dactylosporangium sp. CA-052675]|uniref:hypothetical protein n=1 Tax=Dactylosporangium sp. CA-052675 TaxID=3239927 RepID=UPI003D8F1349
MAITAFDRPDVPDGCAELSERAREPVTAVLAFLGTTGQPSPGDGAADHVAGLLGVPPERRAPLLAWARGELSGEDLLAALRHLVASPDLLERGLLIHCLRGIRAGALEPEELVRTAVVLLAQAPALAAGRDPV